MKLFATQQIRQIDAYTIEHEPVASIDLMERAAEAIFQYLIKKINIRRSVRVFAGPGNNGGDALAVARKMLEYGYEASVYFISSAKLSPGCALNLERLKALFPEKVSGVETGANTIAINPGDVIIDGLFGSGLSRPIEGVYAEIVQLINRTDNYVVAIDTPSGLNGEENTAYRHPIVKADLTLSLHFPKPAFFFPENNPYVNHWEVLPIGLHPAIIRNMETVYYYVTKKDIAPLLKTRNKFAHKGHFGHTLIVAGKKGMGGAMVLNTKACLRAGAGLVTTSSVESNRIILQTAVPEAMFASRKRLENAPDLSKYTAFAIGPGIGTSDAAAAFLDTFLSNALHNCVIDADALNIVANKRGLLKKIPPHSILTPHPKEFERLFGASGNSFERMQKARKEAENRQIYIVLKGAYTMAACPDGNVYFNTSGNAGMATAGSGDVLTGIIAGLLSQGYPPKEAALTAVYLHGLAGDIALQNNQSEESLLAGDMIENIGKAFNCLRED
jgi:NAD(P)H-hydrate epimerase